MCSSLQKEKRAAGQKAATRAATVRPAEPAEPAEPAGAARSERKRLLVQLQLVSEGKRRLLVNLILVLLTWSLERLLLLKLLFIPLLLFVQLLLVDLASKGKRLVLVKPAAVRAAEPACTARFKRKKKRLLLVRVLLVRLLFVQLSLLV